MGKEAFKIAAHLRRGKNVDGQILLGPIVWQPYDNKIGKWWYFIAVTADSGKARFDKLGAESEKMCVDFRLAVLAALATRHKPVVIIDMDDELELAKMTETLWPGAKIKQIRQQIEAERATKH